MSINHNRPSNTPSPSVSHEEAIGVFLVASHKCEVVNLERMDSVQLVGRTRALVHHSCSVNVAPPVCGTLADLSAVARRRSAGRRR